MDGEKQYFLHKLIEELTTSGKEKLDEEKFKRVKKICKESDLHVLELYNVLSKQLKKRHAEIRYSAFQICDEIFRRSHCFRELLLKDFKQFARLVLGLDDKRPLPKPYAVAQKLKQKCVETIQQWYDDFGEGYLTLRLGYNYLRDCKRLDFAELTARTEAQRQRDEEERQRLENIKNKRIDKIKDDLQNQSTEIKSVVKQLQNGFKLLIPDVHNFFIPVEDEDDPFGNEINSMDMEEMIDEDDKYGSEYMRCNGIVKGTNVMINLEDVQKVKETPDNEIVIQNMKEHHTLLKTKLLPQIKKWEETMRPYSEGNGLLIKQILDLKILVDNNLRSFDSLKIEPQIKETKNKTIDDFDSDDDDDDFIEVPFDDPRVQRAYASEAALLGIDGPSWGDDFMGKKSADLKSQPSTSSSSKTSDFGKSSSGVKLSPKKSIIDKCPDSVLSKMSFKPARHHNPLAGLSQVWTAAPDLHERDDENTGGILGVATQRVHYESSWEPVLWTCHAPLKSGGLCPRKDREKCPFHGRIVPRNEIGEPVSAEDAARIRAEQEQYERDHPVWQDPHLLAEIKAQTGVDLKMPKGKSKRKRRYENLTDIRKTTPKERLAKKVLSKKAVRRMNKALKSQHSTWGSCNFNPS